VQLRASVNTPRPARCTQILCALKIGRFDVIKLLAELGADINTRAAVGFTYIHSCSGRSCCRAQINSLAGS
jgi:ankyrin repeat protein